MWINWPTFSLNQSKLSSSQWNDWFWTEVPPHNYLDIIVILPLCSCQLFCSAAAWKGWLWGSWRWASVPALSSPRRSHLALLGGGSAACGNAELKVRHKYGAKRVFKLEIRAAFPPFPPCCCYPGGSGRRCEARSACASVQSGGEAEWTPAGGVEARHGCKWRQRRAQCFIFEGGTLRNSPGFFSESSLGNKASFSIPV